MAEENGNWVNLTQLNREAFLAIGNRVREGRGTAGDAAILLDQLMEQERACRELLALQSMHDRMIQERDLEIAGLRSELGDAIDDARRAKQRVGPISECQPAGFGE